MRLRYYYLAAGALIMFLAFAIIIGIRAYAEEPKIIMNGQYVIDINEAPPIEDVSRALDVADETRPVYADISMTEAEGDLLARILWAEANNQQFLGQCAVVEVVFNRVLSDEWPDTVEGVLSQRGQFATWKSRNKVRATQIQDDAISEVLRETSTVLPSTDYVFFDRRGVNGKAHIRIEDHVFGR